MLWISSSSLERVDLGGTSLSEKFLTDIEYIQTCTEVFIIIIIFSEVFFLICNLLTGGAGEGGKGKKEKEKMKKNLKNPKRMKTNPNTKGSLRKKMENSNMGKKVVGRDMNMNTNKNTNMNMNTKTKTNPTTTILPMTAIRFLSSLL